MKKWGFRLIGIWSIFVFLLFVFYPLAGTSCLGHFYALYKTKPVQDKLHLIKQEIAKESYQAYQHIKNSIKNHTHQKTNAPKSLNTNNNSVSHFNDQTNQQEDELNETDRAFLNRIITEKTQKQNHSTAIKTP